MILAGGAGFAQGQGRVTKGVDTYPATQTIGSCGDFDVVANYDVVLKWMLRFDRNGQPVKEMDRVGLAERLRRLQLRGPDEASLREPG